MTEPTTPEQKVEAGKRLHSTFAAALNNRLRDDEYVGISTDWDALPGQDQEAWIETAAALSNPQEQGAGNRSILDELRDWLGSDDEYDALGAIHKSLKANPQLVPEVDVPLRLLKALRDAVDRFAAQRPSEPVQDDVERLKKEIEELEDRFEFCDNCERPAREGDLATVWCNEGGEQVDARICAVCRLEARPDVERLREAQAALADFDDHGDYEGVVQALRNLLPAPDVEPQAVEANPDRPGCGQWTEFGFAKSGDRIVDWFGPSEFFDALAVFDLTAAPLEHSKGLDSLDWTERGALVLAVDTMIAEEPGAHSPEIHAALLRLAVKLPVINEAALSEHSKGGLEDGAALIAAERARQVGAEGWTPEHDDRHSSGELADGAVAYIVAADTGIFVRTKGGTAEEWWPWTDLWKPTDNPVRNLEKAGALIAAEIDRLHRASPQPNQGSDQPKDCGGSGTVPVEMFGPGSDLVPAECTGCSHLDCPNRPARQPDQPVEEDRVEIAQTFQRWAREKRAAAVHFVGPEKEQTNWFAKGLDCAADYLLTPTSDQPKGEGR